MKENERRLDGKMKVNTVEGKALAVENVRAFAALSDEDRKMIREHRSDLLDVFLESHMLSYDNNLGRQRGYLPILDLARKVDFEALVAASQLVIDTRGATRALSRHRDRIWGA